MTGRSTVIAQIEMYRLAEETTPKVRRELIRLDCQKKISVKQEDMNLRLNYHDRSAILHPHILLSILERIEPDKPPEDVWKSITGEHQDHNDSAMKKMAFLMLVLTLVAFATGFLSRS